MTGRLLEVQVTRPNGDGVVVIRCAGEIDLSTCDELIERIEWSYTPGLRVIRIDLPALGFIDSTGLHCLMEAQKRCAEHDVRFEIVPSDAVLRLFQRAGMDGHFELGEASDPTTGTAPCNDEPVTS
jgi:anti-anti-sigma factor